MSSDGAASGKLPRLLATAEPGRPTGIDEHAAFRGPLPWADSRAARARLLECVDESGLRGRGGSGFPLATKMRAVARGRGPRYVVANGAEGEPASRKDEALLTMVPHLILDGAVLAATTVGADVVSVCVKADSRQAVDAVAQAIAERAAAGVDPVEILLARVSSRYVAGEESALIHHLNGGPGKPTFVPPRPFERGVNGRPTLIQNVETLAHLALIARYGAPWFRQLGTDDDPGSVLITISGAVANPGVFEIPAGTTVGQLVRGAGGAQSPIDAFLIGGYAGKWFSATPALKLALGHAALRAANGTLGPGLVYALPEGSCGVSETARIARYLAAESSGQCGPCVHGLDAIAGALEEISAGHAPVGTHEWVAYWADAVAGRGACHHPDGAIRLVSSCLEVFSDEVDRHEEGAGCVALERV